ncbi:carbohydrate-binding protein [bacterium]
MKFSNLFWIPLFITAPIMTFSAETTWGHLTNPGFENQPVKSTFFFAGSSRNGIQYYDVFASSNEALFTIHPSDSRHLAWSVNAARREFAVDAIIEAGINVINMSYWGPPGTDNWAWWAPMQTSTGSHDELFDAAVDQPVLIAPYIESYAETPNSPSFIFRDDFPGSSANPSPLFIAACKDLIDRYIINPDNPDWPDQWARVYDQTGKKRYLISIIHVSSNQANMSHEKFAKGFDQAAQKIFTDTGIRVGFVIDVMPPGTYAPGYFRPAPQTTGPWLATQNSVLGIQCFISEIWVGTNDETQLINWKQQFANEWIQTGIPFILDISPGYDAHIVFPGSALYGNTASWRDALTQLVFLSQADGVTYNSWNGYTEGMAGMPTQEYGDANAEWMSDIFNNFAVGSYFTVPGKIEAESFAQMSGVLTETTTDAGGGLNVGWVDDGDWMEYNVVLFESGLYSADLRLAKFTDDFNLVFLELDGQRLTRFVAPGTGGWQNWTTVSCPLTMQAGPHQLRVLAQGGGWNFNWMEFEFEQAVDVHEIPGKIEAEAFTEMNGVETEQIVSDIINLAYFDNQDWIDYQVDVQEAGLYDITFQVALDSGQPDGQGELQKDGTVLCEFDISSTGGWDQWSAVTCMATLEAGEQILRVYVSQAPWNLDWIEFSKHTSSIEIAAGNRTMSSVLHQNYPNPFNPLTKISYYLPVGCRIKLDVFDANGRRITQLVNEEQTAGNHHIQFDGSGLASGVYLYKIETASIDHYFIDSRKIMLFK